MHLLCLATFGSSASWAAEPWERERAHDRASELVAFVQPERLYWRPFHLPGVRPAEFKLLSFDEHSGARTLLVRLPAGWKQAPGYHSADLEMFVFKGGVSMSGEPAGRYAYAYYPAGHTHSISTEFGATVLQMWSGKPDYVASAESRAGARSGDAIEGWRYGDSRSIGPADFPAFRDEPFREDSPIRIKLMRHDEDSGEKTWIAVLPGGGPAMSGDGDLPPWASSASWEEGFLLGGDMTVAECVPQGEVAGTYTIGGYFFRPAGRRYGGPGLYSNGFAIWLFRSGPGHRVRYHDVCRGQSKPGEAARAGR